MDKSQEVKNQDYKKCFVPMCLNRGTNCPNKLFIFVPMNQSVRKKWFDAVQRPYKPTSGKFYCCEDHFDVNNLLFFFK